MVLLSCLGCSSRTRSARILPPVCCDLKQSQVLYCIHELTAKGHYAQVTMDQEEEEEDRVRDAGHESGRETSLASA